MSRPARLPRRRSGQAAEIAAEIAHLQSQHRHLTHLVDQAHTRGLNTGPLRAEARKALRALGRKARELQRIEEGF